MANRMIASAITLQDVARQLRRSVTGSDNSRSEGPAAASHFPLGGTRFARPIFPTRGQAGYLFSEIFDLKPTRMASSRAALRWIGRSEDDARLWRPAAAGRTIWQRARRSRSTWISHYGLTLQPILGRCPGLSMKAAALALNTNLSEA